MTAQFAAVLTSSVQTVDIAEVVIGVALAAVVPTAIAIAVNVDSQATSLVPILIVAVFLLVTTFAVVHLRANRRRG
jgi:uncharacterized membrane protein YcaP (DUF421 family)